MGQRKKQGLARLWQLVMLLDSTRAGLTVRQLAARLEWSRSTVYRYLGDLESAGVAVHKRNVVGEMRYQLRGEGMPAVVPSSRQLAALYFARNALGSWEGTDVVEQLDTLLARWGALAREPLALTRKHHPATAPALLGVIDRALRGRRRITLEYRGVRDAATERREVDPLSLHEHHGNLYLFGFDHARSDYRLYKLARIAAAQTLELPVGDHRHVDLDQVFSRSVKVWRGPVAERLVVRLSAKAARFAAEYPLVPGQTVEMLPDGSALVRAEVAGVVEAMRWVLSWGADAEAVAPQELRTAVRRQVEGAAVSYGPRASLLSRKQPVSQKVRRGRTKLGR
jgi:proteasome accessory factor B